MFVVTGAAGFIGSNMISYLNGKNISDIVALDDFEIDNRLGFATRANYTNLQSCKFSKIYGISLNENDILPKQEISAVFHFGAIADTLEKDIKKIDYYNTKYTEVLAKVCKKRNIPLLFASTAAVYGNNNRPLNLYAESKLKSEESISDYAACFRLFNVYGRNESHKKRMSSVIYRWYKEILEQGTLSIFENSHNYKRDFIYVEDVCSCWYNCYLNFESGIFDLGSGKQNSFENVSDIILNIVGGVKQYIEMPSDLKDQYQTSTLANIENISKKGWIKETTTINDGISKYLKHLKEKYETKNLQIKL